MASHPGPLSLEEICEIVNKYFEEIIPRKIQRIVGEQYRYDMIHLLDYLARSPTGDHLAREVYAAFDKECNTTAIFKLGRCLEQVLWLDWGQNTRCAELLFNLRRHDPVVVGYSITWALSRVHGECTRFVLAWDIIIVNDSGLNYFSYSACKAVQDAAPMAELLRPYPRIQFQTFCSSGPLRTTTITRHTGRCV